MDIQAKFLAYHEEFPDVYDWLLAAARHMKKKGERGSIGRLWESLRALVRKEKRENEFSFPNSFRSRYARKLMAENADLVDFFEIRELKS